MLIQRGGITRDIDENRLQEYIAKGYKQVEGEEKQEEAPKAKKG